MLVGLHQATHEALVAGLFDLVQGCGSLFPVRIPPEKAVASHHL